MGGRLGVTPHFALHAAKYSGVATIGARGMATFQSLIFATLGFGFYEMSFVEKTTHWGTDGPPHEE